MGAKSNKAPEKERRMPFNKDVLIFDESQGTYVTLNSASTALTKRKPLSQSPINERDMTPFHKGYDAYQRKKAEGKLPASKKKVRLAETLWKKKKPSPSGDKPVRKAQTEVEGKENQRPQTKAQKVTGPNVDLGQWLRHGKGHAASSSVLTGRVVKATKKVSSK